VPLLPHESHLASTSDSSPSTPSCDRPAITRHPGCLSEGLATTGPLVPTAPTPAPRAQCPPPSKQAPSGPPRRPRSEVAALAIRCVTLGAHQVHKGSGRGTGAGSAPRTSPGSPAAGASPPSQRSRSAARAHDAIPQRSCARGRHLRFATELERRQAGSDPLRRTKERQRVSRCVIHSSCGPSDLRPTRRCSRTSTPRPRSLRHVTV
jgi:hypothetical protein